RLKTEIAPALRHLSTGIMASGSQLVELDLSDNAFGPNGVVGIVELLSSPSCFTLKVLPVLLQNNSPSCKILRMNNQGLGHEGCRYLTQALQKGRQASNKRGLTLKVFSGGRNRLENVGAQMLSEVFADMGSLEELSLYQNGIGIHGIEGIHALVKILKRNPSLRLLNLSDNNLTPKGGEAIAKSLQSLGDLE
ncbi:Ran GTPase-activating protein 1, partial [Paragonimus westermani]